MVKDYEDIIKVIAQEWKANMNSTPERVFPGKRFIIDMQHMERDHACKEMYETSQKAIESWWDKARRRAEIVERKYYGGFQVGKDKSLFKEELDTLEDSYLDSIENITEEINDSLDDLVDSLEDFCALYRKGKAIREKLEDLQYK